MSRSIFKTAIVLLLLSVNVAPGYALSPFDFFTDEGEEKDSKSEGLGEVLESDMFLFTTSEGEFSKSAQLVVLDKRLGKPSAPIILVAGKETQYEGMNLTLQRCWQEKEEKLSKDARALVMVESLEGEKNVVNLWISSKFPGISNLQNERFELLLQKCLATS